MKYAFCLLVIGLLFFISGCEKVSDSAVELSVDFTWEGLEPCDWGNPEIHVSGVPERTKMLIISMYDNNYSYNHGKVLIPYTGERMFEMNKFRDLQGPCPPGPPGRYEITIKALDKNKVVIGIGSKERSFPEKE